MITLLKLSLFIHIAVLPALSLADTITIGLFRNAALHDITLKPEKGSLILKTDNSIPHFYKLKEPVHITGSKNNVSIIFNDEMTLNARDVYIIPADGSENFLLIPVQPIQRGLKIKGRLHFFAIDGIVQVFNDVGLEDYVSAVVDGEAGRLKPVEFYKAQAILIRTYTLAHRYRHVTEGFDLCDGVHCQKFNGVTDYPDIIKATNDTKDLVLIDASYNFITAAYFSNCGGWTANSKDVWQIQQPYLVSRKDTFCLRQKHSLWVQKTTLKQWKNYLFKATRDSILFSLSYNSFTNYQPYRYSFYKAGNDSIPFSVIRIDWKFNSAFFDVLCLHDSVIFYGRGYGHGVGLCQEGGIKMAETGYHHKDILNYYFQEVFLIDKNAILYFSVD